MRRTALTALALLTGLWIVLATACSPEGRDDKQDGPTDAGKPKHTISLSFSGGPQSGTFNVLTQIISSLVSNSVEWIDMIPRKSGGSLSNLCALNEGQTDMAILYAGDGFLGRHGKLECPGTGLDRVRAMAYLYGAPAHLVVRQDSDIKSIHDLKGRIVAVGNVGSGAALSAERFFDHLGLWEHLDRRNIGYSEAATEFGAGRVDAFWVLAGAPNASVIEAAAITPIRLLRLHEAGLTSTFYDLFPFYARTEISAGTYEGQAEPVPTFQDSALWCTRKDLDEATVYHALKTIFSENGLQRVRGVHKAVRSMSIEHSLDNLSVPLHPGAVCFWSEKGMHIPAILLP